MSDSYTKPRTPGGVVDYPSQPVKGPVWPPSPSGPSVPGRSETPAATPNPPPAPDPLRPTQPVPGPTTGLSPQAILKPIRIVSSWSGYFSVQVNYERKPHERIFLTVGNSDDAIDISSGFSRQHHQYLLELLARKKYFASAAKRTVGCRAFVVQASNVEPDLQRKFNLYTGGSGPSCQQWFVNIVSQEQTLELPVIPIEQTLGTGIPAASAIGRTAPWINYKEREGGLFLGRYLSPAICGRYWFLFANKLELDPAKRCLDCTTFVMSAYQNTKGAMDGNAACDNVGAGVITKRMSVDDMKTYIADNPGEYFILKYPTKDSVYTAHIMMYGGGFVHEFTAANPDSVRPGEGYRQSALSNKAFDNGCVYALRSMP